MGKILILREVLNQALENPEHKFVLFGKPQAVTSPKEVYDLYFTGISISPEAVDGLYFTGISHTEFARYSQEQGLVIPVLPQANHDSTPQMYELNARFPKFTIFGARELTNFKKTVGGVEQLVPGLNLNFYEINKVSIGTELSMVPEYTVTDDTECFKLIPDWENFRARLNKEKEIIWDKYI